MNDRVEPRGAGGVKRRDLLAGASGIVASIALGPLAARAASAPVAPVALAAGRRSNYRAIYGAFSALPTTRVVDADGDAAAASFAATYAQLPPDIRASMDFFLDGVEDDGARGAFGRTDNTARALHLKRRFQDSSYYRGGPELKCFMVQNAVAIVAASFPTDGSASSYLELLS